MEDEYRTWNPYDAGATLGKTGLVAGKIGRDEEYGDADDPEDADARVTLETVPDGYAVTANLYGGWLQETARFAREADANAAFEMAKTELSRLADLIPDEDDKNVDDAVDALNRAVAVFASHFGGQPTL